MTEKTPKQQVVAEMDRPFALVDKSERKPPLRRSNPRDCAHPKAYKTDAHPTAGPSWVCTECGRITSYPEDLSG
jgi:hypothetical protein